MRQRLPIALSVTALVVAVLGSTSLGEAARNGMASGVSKAKRATGLTTERSKTASRGARGRRGPRGYRGPRGPRGFLGAPGEKGEKGDKGDTGPSDAYEARYCSMVIQGCTGTPIDVTWATREAAPFVVTVPNLPAGAYSIVAQVTLTPIDLPSNWRIECYLRAPLVGEGGEGVGSARLVGGTDALDEGEITIPIAFGASVPGGGSAGLKCYRMSGSGVDPTITRVDIVATRVALLTRN